VSFIHLGKQIINMFLSKYMIDGLRDDYFILNKFLFFYDIIRCTMVLIYKTDC
jgi:hypothetical protein